MPQQVAPLTLGAVFPFAGAMLAYPTGAHASQIAINFTSQTYASGSAVNNIARFDAATGTALTPFSSADTLGSWDIAFDAATGKLYGIAPNSIGSGTQGDRIRAWSADGSYQDIVVNYSSIGLAEHVSAYADNPDMVIMSQIPEPGSCLLAGFAMVGLVVLRRKVVVGARRHHGQ